MPYNICFGLITIPGFDTSKMSTLFNDSKINFENQKRKFDITIEINSKMLV